MLQNLCLSNHIPASASPLLIRSASTSRRTDNSDTVGWEQSISISYCITSDKGRCWRIQGFPNIRSRYLGSHVVVVKFRGAFCSLARSLNADITARTRWCNTKYPERPVGYLH
jgi:hypothetical protein